MKRLKIRRDDRCRSCDRALPVGTEAWWDKSEKAVHCLTCVGSPSAPVAATEVVDRTETRAGASARREYERRAARERAKHEQAMADDAAWRTATIERRPLLGRLATALTAKPTVDPEKQSTTAWKVGAEGEERVAEVMAGVAGIEVLHDRRVPGSRANIDHLVVGPAGVFVVDPKNYKKGSAIEVRDVGRLWRSDLRLYVGGRNRTKLVIGVRNQVEVVRTALGSELSAVPVRGVLCFIGGTWGWRAKPKSIGDITAIWPSALPGLVGEEGPFAVDVERIADHLRVALPPAVV